MNRHPAHLGAPQLPRAAPGRSRSDAASIRRSDAPAPRQRSVVSVVLLCGEEEHAELRAIQAARLGRVHLRAADVLGRVGTDAAVDVGEPVEAAHGREASIDRGRRQSALLHPGPEHLDVRTRRAQHFDVVVGRPLEEAAQILPVRLQGPSAVASQEQDCNCVRLACGDRAVALGSAAHGTRHREPRHAANRP